MVYYHTSNVVPDAPAAFIYVGKDKVENEELIAHGWPEDVWFHADNLSSAHIYLRLQPGQSWENIDPKLVTDCVQLTKANSIEGNKKDNITVIYTPWSNLKKDKSMAVGQVGFKKSMMVKRVHVEKRENPIVNRLNKTRKEEFPDLRQMKVDRDREMNKKDRAAQLTRAKEDARLAKEHKEQAWRKEHMYDDLHTEENLQQTSNQDRDEDFLDDFF